MSYHLIHYSDLRSDDVPISSRPTQYNILYSKILPTFPLFILLIYDTIFFINKKALSFKHNTKFLTNYFTGIKINY